jgi:CheY-like chemotaxis protein
MAIRIVAQCANRLSTAIHDDGFLAYGLRDGAGQKGASLAPPRKVLVADDSLLTRGILSARIAKAGFEVLLCNSVASAEAVDATQLSCALLDLDLGDGEGTEVAATLRAVSPELPIAFFSGSATAQPNAQALGPVFVKPDELEDAIRWICTHAT